MNLLLNLSIVIPLLGFIANVLISGKKEKLISGIAFVSVGLHFFGGICFILYWMYNGHPTINVKGLTLFKSPDYEFYFDFYFDKITAVYFFVGAFLSFLVTIYSKAYMHRDEGYKRFYNNILFFYLGYNIAVFAGNLETLFMGWEILGICSFLLIAFYRNRYLPVKNAIKVITVYRIGDIGIILAIWMNHHLWHQNISFIQMSNQTLVHEHLQNHSLVGIFISLMFLITAAAKSAQLPFSSWLPRAMEGPTPSSAIFYGSLSVHLGVFLLLRTYAFWENQISVRIIIVIIGLSTSIVTSLIARVQSSIKGQIAYGSASQIGLIFIEVACGFENLALIHFAGNAFLRTYQLLVSPSTVNYLLTEQYYNFAPKQIRFEDRLPKKLKHSLYLLSLKEWNLDSIMYRLIWKPIKQVGKKLRFLTLKKLFAFFIPTYILAFISYAYEDSIPPDIHHYLPLFFSLIGFIMVVKSFSERKSPQMSWLLILMNHFWIALAISFNEHYKFSETLLYLSGISVAGLIGYICLQRLKAFETKLNMNTFHGHIYEHPRVALAFLICCLALSGFPITPTFIGIDLLFSHIHVNQILVAAIAALGFIISGLSLIRMYARIFLGPHEKTYHETPYRSS